MTRQQRKVVDLMVEGLTNKDIAWRLSITEATAKAHVSAVLKAFGCTNRTQAALCALRLRHERDA